MEKIHKSTFTEKLGFGLGELPGTMNSILAVVLTMFYTDNVGLAAGAVGTMFFVSRLFDGISDLLTNAYIIFIVLEPLAGIQKINARARPVGTLNL